VPGTNTLAYFAEVKVTKKKKLNNLVTMSIRESDQDPEAAKIITDSTRRQ
jgi:hypothetical protein